MELYALELLDFEFQLALYRREEFDAQQLGANRMARRLRLFFS